jgi:glucose-6-phosphate 1-dehydrogenase
VLQNHMLQLLALVGMDLPADDDDDMHERKLDALRSARVVEAGHRARYTAGTLADGRAVPSYADEEGVDPARCTETFVETVLELEDARWGGTRFVLRAGKALARQRKLVRLCFRTGGEVELGIDGPTEIALRLRGAGNAPVDLIGRPPDESLPAYAHVLDDILGGRSDLSVGAAEAEEAWRVVAPIGAAWEAGDVPLESYTAGSDGPT